MIDLRTLDRSKLFSKLSLSERETVVSLGRELAVADGEVFIEAGAEGKSFFILVSGKLEVRRNDQYLDDVLSGDYSQNVTA